MSAQFPVNLNLEGRRVLVVGAGRVALRKTEQLLAAGAVVTVVAPDVVGGFESLPVTMVRREFGLDDLDGQRLVITATGARDVDQSIYDECERRGVWVNSADDPDRCSFTLPAAVRRGELLVTVSTAGCSPAFSSYLRRRLDSLLDPVLAAVVDDLASERARYHRSGTSTETVDWEPIIAAVLARHGVEGELFGTVEGVRS
jgi:siroheme synthase-like protein